ncbi:DUF6090 family protein [Salinimicrobium soli]|uniref:DUF6090 family protein n=1 Tax=Salinimicrobium soli TaxID=1254399 RepID=UPI003AACB701
MENKTSRYLKYAVGEILLVVIGILIALQINNANQKRIENEELWGYLQNIRSNVKTDLEQANNLNFVLDQLAANTPRFWQLRSKSDFTYNDYRLTEDHLNTIAAIEAFNPNSYGFETLKSTGYIGKLQGTDMEVLLFNYYDLVEKIKKWNERDLELFENLVKEEQINEWGISAEVSYKMMQDSTYFPSVRDKYLDKLNSRIYDSAVAMFSYNPFRPLLLELNFLGRSIISLIDGNTLEASPEIMRSVELYNSGFSDIGEEEVVINGIIPRSVTFFGASNQGFEKVKLEGQEDRLKFSISPNLEWAAAMLVVDSLGQNVRASKDFREYQSIELELKGEEGNEELALALKDKYDPDDGTESRADLKLSKNWKTYRFDLRKNFPTADLKILHQLAGFVTLDPNGVTFYVRNIRFLEE